MTDSPRPGSFSDPAGAQQAYSDPAYAGSVPLGPSYSATSMPLQPTPTEPLPPYWTQTYSQTGPASPSADEPPEPPRGPGPWLWAVTGFALASVIGLVIWLVFSVFNKSNPSTQATSIPATPSTSTSTSRTPTATPSWPPSLPSIPLPTFTIPTLPTAPNTPGSGETEPVVYEVTGEGRAINIIYIDTGGVMHTEFNVLLPWEKEVDLPKPAEESASVTVINSGRNITCTISIDGVEVQEQTSALLTVCGPLG